MKFLAKAKGTVLLYVLTSIHYYPCI